MQRGASFNLDAPKAEMAKRMSAAEAASKELASDRNDLNAGALKVGCLRGVGQAGRRVFVPLKHDGFGLWTTQRREHLVKALRSGGW